MLHDAILLIASTVPGGASLLDHAATVAPWLVGVLAVVALRRDRARDAT